MEDVRAEANSTPCVQRLLTIEVLAGKGQKTYLCVDIEELILFTIYLLFFLKV